MVLIFVVWETEFLWRTEYRVPNPLLLKRANATGNRHWHIAATKRGQVVDIMEALKRSMERVPAKKKPATAPAAKKKKKVS
jgi:non-homologous end joining protein Ku